MRPLLTAHPFRALRAIPWMALLVVSLVASGSALAQKATRRRRRRQEGAGRGRDGVRAGQRRPASEDPRARHQALTTRATTTRLDRAQEGARRRDQDDPKNIQRAEFFLGKTVYQMGYYAGALKIFEDIVAAGPEHTYHGAILKWLAALSRVLPETSASST